VKSIELLLAVCAFGTGMLSAWYWLKASKVPTDPGWGKGGIVEAGIHALSQDAWIAAMLQAASESSRLNKIAARWTAATAALTVTGALIGALSG
jgi:predicted DNA repair protein MutK